VRPQAHHPGHRGRPGEVGRRAGRSSCADRRNVRVTVTVRSRPGLGPAGWLCPRDRGVGVRLAVRVGRHHREYRVSASRLIWCPPRGVVWCPPRGVVWCSPRGVVWCPRFGVVWCPRGWGRFGSLGAAAQRARGRDGDAQLGQVLGGDTDVAGRGDGTRQRGPGRGLRLGRSCECGVGIAQRGVRGDDVVQGGAGAQLCGPGDGTGNGGRAGHRETSSRGGSAPATAGAGGVEPPRAYERRTSPRKSRRQSKINKPFQQGCWGRGGAADFLA
jgi:hypothetical protein